MSIGSEYLGNLNLRANALTVYRSVLGDTAVAALVSLLELPPDEEFVRQYSAYRAALLNRGETPKEYFERLVLTDENVFAMLAAGGQKQFPAEMTSAVFRDLLTLYTLASLSVSDFSGRYPPETLSLLLPLGEPSGEFLGVNFKAHTGNRPYLNMHGADLPELESEVLAAVTADYRKRGCGKFRLSPAGKWNRAEKRFDRVENTSRIRLADLKGYAEEKAAVVRNTLDFLEGLPAQNVLLYGDRGTGKSSTVHGLLNEYAAKGLRVAEIGKSALSDLPLVLDKLARQPFRFIVFIDDLSFSGGDEDYAELKAALEGSIVKAKNIVIYATTNRRHIISERFTARRGDEVHLSDTVQEQMSLSDRFGIVVTYINPAKAEFVKILTAILADRGITLPANVLSETAERYALSRGARSPRLAKQIADQIEAEVKRKKT